MLYQTPKGCEHSLPDITKEGQLINKQDVESTSPQIVTFPVDPETGRILNTDLYLKVIAPDFSLRKPVKSITVTPGTDSSVVTFYLTPVRLQEFGRITVELRSSDQKSPIDAVPLTTEITTVSLGSIIKQKLMLFVMSTLKSEPEPQSDTLRHEGDWAMGDEISVGDISDSKGVAIGPGSIANLRQNLMLVSLSRPIGLILAIVAILTLVIYFVFLQGWDRAPSSATQLSPAPTPEATIVTPTPTSTSEPTTIPTGATAISNKFDRNCIADYVTDLPPENIKNLEVDIDGTIMERNEHDLLVLRLTEEREPIGLIHFLLFPEASSFKIKTILDAQCMTVTSNKEALDNWEIVEFDLNGIRYGLKMGFHGTIKRIRTTGLKRLGP